MTRPMTPEGREKLRLLLHSHLAAERACNTSKAYTSSQIKKTCEQVGGYVTGPTRDDGYCMLIRPSSIDGGWLTGLELDERTIAVMHLSGDYVSPSHAPAPHYPEIGALLLALIDEHYRHSARAVSAHNEVEAELRLYGDSAIDVACAILDVTLPAA